METVRTFPLFDDLPAAAVDEILALAETRTFRRRQPLFRQGDRITRLFLICDGTVKLTQVGEDGQEVIMRLAGTGNAIAAVAAFARPERFPVGAAALEKVVTLSWERPVAQDLARRHPDFAAALTREISRLAHGLQRRLLEVSTERVPQRLARLLLRLADQAGVAQEGAVLIDMPLTRQELAQMAGTTLYTVSRLLSEWADQGLVTTGRVRVSVRSESGLRQIAGELDASDPPARAAGPA